MSGATATAPARASDRTLLSSSSRIAARWWYAFFFVSGFPALLYQIVWERALFTLYGVNIESVTMVVTAFMLGLGLGSLLGGAISRRRDWPLLRIFAAAELLIGSYGLLSLRLFHWAANFNAGSPPLQTGLTALALVAFPTGLMGATLPILVSYTVRLSHEVGTSVSALYAANTFGSAVACFCAGLFLMRWLGQAHTVAIAAILNLLVGAAVMAWSSITQSPSESRTAVPASPMLDSESPLGRISFVLALVISGTAGFIALAYEIVWYRLFAFTTGGLAKSFAFLLGAYLAGIAGGSLLTNYAFQRVKTGRSFIRVLITTIVGANVLSFLVAPFLSFMVVRASYMWSLPVIGFAAACLGALFPLLCHIAVAPDECVGARLSYLYLSNIIGSALGSYVTGFLLMEVLPLRQVTMVLAILGLGLGAVILLNAQLTRRAFILSATAIFATALCVVQFSAPLFHHMYERMLLKGRYLPSAEFGSVVENRSGVVAVTQNGIVFGGGIYDGRFNVNLINDTNGLERPFALSYFHPDPQEVLMIGLSSGSWAQVIANHPQVKHLTIVEINPGYLPLIAHHDEVASLLQNPKVKINIDDGRRWLIRNPERKFDVVIFNSTFHWRSNASNLLSVEFLNLVRRHLEPGGVHFYNTTESNEVMATGVKVFPFGMRLANFMIVSDQALDLNAERWLQILLSYRIDGKPVFDLSQPQDRQRLGEVMALRKTMDQNLPTFFTLESADHIRARTAGIRIITDDNMGTEWTQ
ncbi:MAG: fused MFS/spermidine synthase [Acidobacteriaceae bacterium]|nr:fused MFS/spermidine synthase [Acidobacteriaceae bacterium]